MKPLASNSSDRPVDNQPAALVEDSMSGRYQQGSDQRAYHEWDTLACFPFDTYILRARVLYWGEDSLDQATLVYLECSCHSASKNE